MKFITIRNPLAWVVLILVLLADKTPAATIVTIQVTASPNIAGTTSGGGMYPVGTKVVLTATATNGCWTFSDWSDGSTNNLHTVTVSFEVTNYTAYFSPNSNLINTASSPTNGGMTGGGGWCLCGSNVSLTATSNPCWKFTNWSDGSTNNPLTITAFSDTNYTANFVPVGNLTITTGSSPTNGGTTTGDTTTNCGASVTLAATATNACWTFTHWSDGSTNNQNTVTVSYDVTNYTAYFVQNSNLVTTASSPTNGGMTGGGGWYLCGSNVSLTATATNACWTFTHWSDDSTENPHTITAFSDTNFTANFVQKSFSIQTVVAPTNSGTTTGDTTTNCGASVTVTATNAAGYIFMNWTINKMVYNAFTHSFHLVQEVVSTLPQDTFTVRENLVLTANFLKTCEFSISPTNSLLIPQSGGGGTVIVTTSSGCDWTYTNLNPQIHITDKKAYGLKYSVDPAPTIYVPGTPATIITHPVLHFTFLVAGKQFTVNQTERVVSHSPILTNLPEE